MRRTAIVVGNCQIYPVIEILKQSPDFAKHFSIKLFQPCHIITAESVKKLHRALQNCQILITQPIKDEYRNFIGLGTNKLKSIISSKTELITIPSLYFNCYNPELFTIKNVNLNIFSSIFSYHHKQIFQSFISGYSISQANEFINDINSNFVKDSFLFDAFKEIAQRENNIDIKMLSFIQDNYKKDRLFWTFNHPAYSTLSALVRKILSVLSLHDDLAQSAQREYLDHTIFPILPSIRKRLDIYFKDNYIYRISGTNMNMIEIITYYYEFYQKNPDLVVQNAKLLQLSQSFQSTMFVGEKAQILNLTGQNCGICFSQARPYAAFPNAIQKVILECCKPIIRIFTTLEFQIKFEMAPSDYIAGSKNFAVRVLAVFLSCFGPKPEKTGFSMKAVRSFLGMS